MSRWPLTLYGNLPAGIDGITIAPVILIRSSLKDNDALYRHEARHLVREFIWMVAAVAVQVVVFTAIDQPVGWEVVPSALLGLALYGAAYLFSARFHAQEEKFADGE